MGFEPKYFKVNNLLETMRKVFFKKSTKCETDIEGAGCVMTRIYVTTHEESMAVNRRCVY